MRSIAIILLMILSLVLLGLVSLFTTFQHTIFPLKKQELDKISDIRKIEVLSPINKNAPIKKIHSSEVNSTTSFNIVKLSMLYNTDLVEYQNYLSDWYTTDKKALLFEMFKAPFDKSSRFYLLQKNVIGYLIQHEGINSYTLLVDSVGYDIQPQAINMLLLESFIKTPALLNDWFTVQYIGSIPNEIASSFLEDIFSLQFNSARAWFLSQPQWLNEADYLKLFLLKSIRSSSAFLVEDMTLLGNLNNDIDHIFAAQFFSEILIDKPIDWRITQIFDYAYENQERREAFYLAFPCLVRLNAVETLEYGFDYFRYDPIFFRWILNQQELYQYSLNDNLNDVINMMPSKQLKRNFLENIIAYQKNNHQKFDSGVFANQIFDDELRHFVASIID
ncbi:hypothetical protein [Catenovulum adriaticum]|uniref:Uncharacterized protein n=1 Tax=Catenovulum adriaticum TaxID=2984846 RepID=A0ABY7AQB6_9ALTE|nr:hypothetical protein [Catenovulum sp. TS8]WAJ71744.1 hypothetical protein OLW01_15505 [Catenovulum sp. TS8]